METDVTNDVDPPETKKRPKPSKSGGRGCGGRGGGGALIPRKTRRTMRRSRRH
jgi:hypothetical protein